MDQETQVSPDAETQNPAPEADESTEVVTPDVEAEQPDDAKPEEDEGDKAIRRMQRRIDKRTADLYRERAEAQQLRERLRQYEQSQQEEPQQYQPDPLTLAKEISKLERVTERANTVAKDGEKRFPDFKQAVTAVAQEVGPLFDQIGRPTPIAEAILDSDDSAALLHYLGTNPDVASDLEGLTPAQLGRRIARIEVQMKEAAKPKQSAAPKPVTPTRSSGRDDGALRDDLPIDEWNRRYQKLMRGG